MAKLTRINKILAAETMAAMEELAAAEQLYTPVWEKAEPSFEDQETQKWIDSIPRSQRNRKSIYKLKVPAHLGYKHAGCIPFSGDKDELIGVCIVEPYYDETYDMWYSHNNCFRFGGKAEVIRR